MAAGKYTINPRRLRFPIDHSPFHRSKVTFQAMFPRPPGLNIKFKAGGVTGADITQAAANVIGARGAGNREPVQFLDKGQDQGFRKLKYEKLNGERADIHLPMNFAVNDNFEYSGAEFKNSLTIAGAAAFEAGNSALEAAKRAISDTSQSFVNFFRGNQSLSTQAANLSLLRAGELVGSVGFTGVANTLSVIGKVALHPNVRNRFTGVSLRSFSFAFKFLPKSPRESREVKDIVKFFRFHAYPNQIPPDTSFGVGYEYPSLFKIRLLSGAGGNFKEVGTPIKYSYLRSISTNYNPTTPVLHDDGSPTEIDLSLTFTEHKTLHRRDIVNEGTAAFDELGQSFQDAGLNTAPEFVKNNNPAGGVSTNTSQAPRGLPTNAAANRSGGPF